MKTETIEQRSKEYTNECIEQADQYIINAFLPNISQHVKDENKFSYMQGYEQALRSIRLGREPFYAQQQGWIKVEEYKKLKEAFEKILQSRSNQLSILYGKRFHKEEFENDWLAKAGLKPTEG